MMQSRRLLPRVRNLLAGFVGLAVCAGAWQAWPGARVTAEPAGFTFNEGEHEKFKYLGVASCASTACHYGSGARGSKGSEYTVWATLDRHANAFRVLLNEQSQTIMRNLKRLPHSQEVHAEKEILCLRCHGPEQTGFHDSQAEFKVDNQDGVACESCHGPAGKWRTIHYLSDWKTKSIQEKAALGMPPTKDLVTRAEVCAECHVGTAEREVNHDLIAAGHPRLNFEFAAYLANMPAHWREQGDNARPDFQARAWAVGQVVSAQAALRLLEARATDSHIDGASKPWPEFAEYDCFACHHDLRDDTRRQKSAFGKRTPGSYPWGTWYYPLLSELGGDAAAATNIGDALKDLQNSMGRTYPDANLVARQARQLRSSLDAWTSSAAAAQNAQKVDRWLATLAQRAAGQNDASWDAAAQAYLALVALHQSSREWRSASLNPEVQARFENLRSMLQFPPAGNSPVNYQSEPFAQELAKLQQLFGK